MSQCPKCGALSAGKFCAQCGAPLPIRCAACGADVSVGHRFCADCGAPVQPDPQPRPGQSSPTVSVGDIGVMRGTIDASTNVHNTTNIGSQTNIAGPVHVQVSPGRREPTAEEVLGSGQRALQARLYAQAIQAFVQLIQMRPRMADAYYYLALATLQGERPRLVSLETIRVAEQHLRSAANADSDCAHALLLWAIVKEDAFVMNGMHDRPPTVTQLLERAGSVERRRVRELVSLMHAPGNKVWEWCNALVAKGG